MPEGFVNYLDYTKKLGKETIYEEAIKNYCASKSRISILQNLIEHLTLRWLGLDASKVDDVSSQARCLTPSLTTQRRLNGFPMMSHAISTTFQRRLNGIPSLTFNRRINDAQTGPHRHNVDTLLLFNAHYCFF